MTIMLKKITFVDKNSIICILKKQEELYIFSSSLDSMYCNILTCLLHTAVVSIFSNFRLLCIYLT